VASPESHSSGRPRKIRSRAKVCSFEESAKEGPNGSNRGKSKTSRKGKKVKSARGITEGKTEEKVKRASRVATFKRGTQSGEQENQLAPRSVQSSRGADRVAKRLFTILKRN